MKKKDDLRINKIVAAILVPLLLVLTAGYASDFLFPEPDRTANAVPIEVTLAATGSANDAENQGDPINELLQSANLERGKRLFRVCAACHTTEKGGATRVGPNLWGFLGRRAAEIQGFNYSNTLKEYGAVWTYENTSKFLTNPRKFFSGGRINMTFAGLSKAKDRADLILFLRSQSDNILPLPE